MKTPDAIACLASLAQETRLAAFRLLVQTGREGLSAGVLAQRLQTPASSLSFHLQALLHAGLITQERQGRQLIYAAGYDRMDALVAYLTENCGGLASRRPAQSPQRERRRSAS